MFLNIVYIVIFRISREYPIRMETNSTLQLNVEHNQIQLTENA